MDIQVNRPLNAFRVVCAHSSRHLKRAVVNMCDMYQQNYQSC